ncbi:MAG: hypothetical protein ACE5RP_00285 [Nitrosopumilus sp.]
MSNRKPFNEDAGYIASKRSGASKGYVVIYDAKEAGIDDSDGKYVVVCQTHQRIVNTTSLPKAREAMKSVDFCEECFKILAEHSVNEGIREAEKRDKELGGEQ